MVLSIIIYIEWFLTYTLEVRESDRMGDSAQLQYQPLGCQGICVSTFIAIS